jgi:hypothetical protein
VPVRQVDGAGVYSNFSSSCFGVKTVYNYENGAAYNVRTIKKNWENFPNFYLYKCMMLFKKGGGDFPV